MPSAAPDAATHRFRTDVAALVAGPDPGRPGVAVSGGPDSMALLLLAHSAWPGRVEAATVDHGLRPEAAAEAGMVADWCAGNGIPHAILRPPEPIRGNIQSAARTARYALLERWRVERGLDWLMTAHHADDQIETMLMRLNRGSGVGGLAGVRARNGVVLRPLLRWRKAELAALAQGAALPVAQDPSNLDPRFDRVALRARLADADWLDPVAAGRSAAALAEADEALDWLTRDLADRHMERDGDALVLARTDFPREVQRRLLLHMLALSDPAAPPPRGDTVEAALDALGRGDKASIGERLLVGGPRWTVRPAPPRRSARPDD